ncbi:MAG: HAMP domain-containing histidine kinase [Bacteroidales bacterium]|nr:HAMP domain-containing histidine kinase [Bacteroidales bacterium]
MNRKVITIIILLTSVSLVAALFTQLFWVRDTWILKEDQFNNSVKIVLKSAVNQLMTSEEVYTAEMANVDTNLYIEHIDLFSVVNPENLDSLLHEEFLSMEINEEFTYGVYRSVDKLFVMGKYNGTLQQLIDSPHWVSLTCLCQTESYLLTVYFPYQRTMILSQMIILPVMSGLFLMVLIFSFFFTIYTVLKQKKLSEMKTDFVNNMTHEFKTPISTISVSSEMLAKDAVVKDADKVKKYAKIIFDENTRLKNQVERVLQIAIIDKDDYKLKFNEVDVHKIIRECMDNFNIQVIERNGNLKSNLEALQYMVTADKEHFTNVINNLLDNANKYSLESPDIKINTINNNGKIEISIEDKGIGIGKENQTDVFKKFHRLQTGNIHNVKGFGIGLFYVKTMVEQMGGNINIESELNKGSRFTLSFSI